MDIDGSEARWLMDRLTDGTDFYLEPVQLLKLAKTLYIMRDNRWFEPIKRLMGIVDTWGAEKFDKHPMSCYKTGSYFNMLDDEKTTKEMRENGKLKSE